MFCGTILQIILKALCSVDELLVFSWDDSSSENDPAYAINIHGTCVQ